MGDEKDASEGRILRYMRSRLGDEFDAVMARLGDPPDLTLLSVEFWNEQTGQTVGGLRPILEGNVLQAAESLTATVPILWDEAVLNREAIEWAGQYTYELVTKLDENSLNVLRRVVPQWLETPGMTLDDLRKQLEPTFSRSRAESIATTETTRSFAEGTRLVQRELEKGGISRVRKWNTSGDELVCTEFCMPLDGKTEDQWQQIVPEADPTMMPPFHPRCRCWTTLVRPK